MPNTLTRGNPDSIQYNLGRHNLPGPSQAKYPDAGPAVRATSGKDQSKVDVLFVNPPSPDGAIWIRSQHRVGRRSRESMIWPQVSLAQLAAMVHPKYSVEIIDAIATRMDWPAFEKRLREIRPRFYVTQVTAPTLTNDMYGAFLAKSLGAWTIAFGTHVTPMPEETMKPFPCLDFVLRGEPEYTLKELVDYLANRNENIQDNEDLAKIQGIVWRKGDELVYNPDRPFIENLDELPIPLHHLLPLRAYTAPMINGSYSFVVTGRGCTGGCKFCIKHVSYQHSVRVRSPKNIQEELWELNRLGVHNVNMYADLFTVNREQVIGLCELLIREGPKVRWMCNSRVDYVDEELLKLMAQAGCWLISWGIESGSQDILNRAHKGTNIEKIDRAIRWSKAAGIKNWGYFIIGLPGETESTIKQTISLAKSLPLDIALFHIAAPYPGTPFFFDVVENGWFRAGTRWEEVDMDCSTVLDYPNIKAEDLERWQKKAFREWAMRPGPALTYLKMLASPGAFKTALEVGIRHLTWARS